MKYWILLIVFALAACTAIKKYTERQVKYNMPFSHSRHLPVWNTENISCKNCHRFEKEERGTILVLGSDAEWKETPMDVKQLMTGREYDQQHFQKPIKELCHNCHVSGGKSSHTPLQRTCTLCHQAIDRSIIPASHSVNWMTSHKLQASFRSSDCSSCHEQRECSDCHFSRQPKMARTHPQGYEFIHSVDARFNASTCDSCHSPSYCEKCHRGTR
jgi:hypothetical protein